MRRVILFEGFEYFKDGINAEVGALKMPPSQVVPIFWNGDHYHVIGLATQLERYADGSVSAELFIRKEHLDVLAANTRDYDLWSDTEATIYAGDVVREGKLVKSMTLQAVYLMPYRFSALSSVPRSNDG